MLYIAISYTRQRMVRKIINNNINKKINTLVDKGTLISTRMKLVLHTHGAVLHGILIMMARSQQ